MNLVPDPLMPSTARFPLSPPQGRITLVAESPSQDGNRPFGMRYGVTPVASQAKHGKTPTRKSKTERTAVYDDGKVSGYTPDIEYYIEMDEE